MKRVSARIFLVFVIALSKWPTYPFVCFAQSIDQPGNSTDSRRPVPSAQSQHAASTKIREIFSSEFADAKTSGKKRALAQMLAQQASEATDSSERWSMLSEALRLATEVGDVPQSLALLERIPQEFAVSHENDGQLETLTKLALKASMDDAESLGRELLRLARKLSGEGDHAQATKAASTALSLARKAKKSRLGQRRHAAASPPERTTAG